METVVSDSLSFIGMDLASFNNAEEAEGICSVTMPASRPCQICPPERTAEECREFQRMHGCHGCDRQGCWHASSSCLFYKRFREPHADALMGDSAPHMRETRVTCTADGSEMEGRRKVNWWTQHSDVRFVVNEAQQFSMGTASGEECNCLVDTLRQRLHLDCDIKAVRAYV